MKPKLLHLAFAAILSLLLSSCFSGNKIVKVVCSESDAQIYEDGKPIGTGTATVKVMKNSYTTISARKVGFYDLSRELYNDKVHPKTSKKETLTLQKDDGFDVSESSQGIANEDVSLQSQKSKDISWDIIVESIQAAPKIDIFKTIDKTSGYIETIWVEDHFQKYTIRTRVIVSVCSSGSSTCYKIKIISEIAGRNNATSKDDEEFKEWSRVLKKYGDIVRAIMKRL